MKPLFLFENYYRFAGEGALVTFGDPETSSLKTSFQEKVFLQAATGCFHPGLFGRR
jgi:hypothetical protein